MKLRKSEAAGYVLRFAAAFVIRSFVRVRAAVPAQVARDTKSSATQRSNANEQIVAAKR